MKIKVRKLDLVALHVTVLPFLFIYSQLAGHLMPDQVTLLFAVGWFGIALATGLNFVEGRFDRVAIVLTVVLVLAAYAIRFGAVTGSPMSINAMAAFGGLASYAAFSRFSDAPLEPLRIVRQYGVIYLAVYALLSLLVDYGQLTQSNALGTGLVMADRAAGQRVYLANGLVAFVGLSALAGLLSHERRFQDYLVIALTGFALFEAQSRFFTTILLSVAAIFFLTRLPKLISVTAFCGATLQAIWFIVCLVDHTKNPFAWFISDGSGYVRSLSFEVARNEVRDHAWLGVGLPYSQFESAWLSVKNFSATDIGYAGVIYTFGIIGFAIYVACMICIAVFGVKQPRTAPALMIGLALTGAVIMVFGSIWYSASSVIFAMLAATFFSMPRDQAAPAVSSATALPKSLLPMR